MMPRWLVNLAARLWPAKQRPAVPVHDTVIFLDIDGVLVTPDCFRRYGASGTRATANPECVENLNRLIRATGAKIVVSSVWRFRHDIDEILRRWGVVGEILGGTPVISRGTISGGDARGLEIDAWLKTSPAAKFVILDDDDDMGPLRHRLVRTNFSTGLTRAEVERAFDLLGVS
jgi:hypothetical protein